MNVCITASFTSFLLEAQLTPYLLHKNREHSSQAHQNCADIQHETTLQLPMHSMHSAILLPNAVRPSDAGIASKRLYISLKLLRHPVGAITLQGAPKSNPLKIWLIFRDI